MKEDLEIAMNNLVDAARSYVKVFFFVRCAKFMNFNSNYNNLFAN